MAFNIFSKPQRDKETIQILKNAAAERGPVFLHTEHYKHSGVFLDLGDNHLFVSHALGRDEIFEHLKGRKLRIQVTSEGQLFEGFTRLAGLGLRVGMPALKLQLPNHLFLNDPRRSIRLSTIGYSTSVTFSSDEMNIFSGKLIDISMTGAAIRPETPEMMERIRMSVDLTIHTDIELEEGWSISTVSTIKNYDSYKIGIEFGPLDKRTHKQLYKYIQKMRKAMIEHRVPVPAEESLKANQSSRQEHHRPCIIIFGQDETMIEKLIRSLKTKYEIIQYPLKISEIRNRVHLEKPAACMLEIQTHHRDAYRQLKKVKTMLGMTVPIMFYTEQIPESHLTQYFPDPGQKSAVLDLKDHQTLRTFRTIETFILRNT